MSATIAWTDERVEMLTRLYAANVSTTKMAHELQCSVKAVEGKVSRLGLSRTGRSNRADIPTEQREAFCRDWRDTSLTMAVLVARYRLADTTLRRIAVEMGVAVKGEYRAGSCRRSGWNEATVAELERLLADGLSFSEIARRLKCTRSAAIAKSHRLGLIQPPKPAPAPRLVKAPLAERRMVARIAARPKLTIIGNGTVIEKSEPTTSAKPPRFFAKAWEPLPGSNPVTLLDRAPFTCRWPVDLAGALDQHFCALVAPTDRYCDEHATLSGHPNQPAKLTVKSLRRWAA